MNAERVGNFVGTLLVIFLLTKVFLWAAKKIGRPNGAVSRMLLANALSLALYTVAMGYSLVPDLTKGELPHLLTAFYMGVLPQLICLGYCFVQMPKRQNAAST